MSRERGLTLAEARARGQGSAHLDADPTFARVIVRKISPRLSWAIARHTGLAADHVTFASIASGIIGGLLVGAGSLPLDLLAVVLLQLAYLLDVADGEVARIRRSAGRRGTYLDLLGHVLQNRALYAGATISLLAVTDRAPWAIAVGFVTLAFAMPFGHYARMQVLGTPAENPEHGGRVTAGPATPGLAGAIRRAYRRLSFLWNYPASMNLFCVALLVDSARFAAGAGTALAIPVLIALFGPSLAAKQVAHAVLLLRRRDW
jgi:phosphatidylglycerophosphate synthase